MFRAVRSLSVSHWACGRGPGRIRGRPAGVPKGSGTSRRRSGPKRHHRTWTTWLIDIVYVPQKVHYFEYYIFQLITFICMDVSHALSYDPENHCFEFDNFELRAPGERLAVLSLRRFRIGAVWRARSERATWTSQRRAKITNKTLGAQEAGSRQPNGRHAHRRK